MARNENIETLSRYTVRVHYHTLCYTDYNVYAGSKLEAKTKAREMFDRHVTAWAADGGCPKILTDMEVKNGN